MSFGPKQTLEEGYNKFVIKNAEGCWDWSGCVPKNPGYGQFRHSMKLERAHRASWLIYFGEIPLGMMVLHKCDNKRCSKPDHLFLGTKLDNNLDMLKKGYHPTIGKSGEENPMAKLTNEEVEFIKSIDKKQYNRHKLAELFGIHYNTVSKIRNKSKRSLIL